MTQFPEMPGGMLNAQPLFSAELSRSFSAGTQSILTLFATVGTSLGMGMFATISIEYFTFQPSIFYHML